MPQTPLEGPKTFLSSFCGSKNILARLYSPAIFQISPATFKVIENPVQLQQLLILFVYDLV